jgi:PAS domain S-box-containing protein
VDVEVQNAPFTWNGRPAVQVIFRDITERRRLAQLEAQTTALITAIVDNAPEGIAISTQGQIIWANDQLARIFGYDTSQQLIGKHEQDFVAAGDRQRLADYGRRRDMVQTAPACYTFTGLCRDGTPVQFAASVASYQEQGRTCTLAFVRRLPAERC